VDPSLDMIEGAKKKGTDRIEVYTAHQYHWQSKAIEPYIAAAVLATTWNWYQCRHDLSLDNIQFFKQNIPGLLEVSIGHALIKSLYLGLENVVNMYLQN
jgi:pyridoxine 5-phosphate synthase